MKIDYEKLSKVAAVVFFAVIIAFSLYVKHSEKMKNKKTIIMSESDLLIGKQIGDSYPMSRLCVCCGFNGNWKDHDSVKCGERK